jgi:hypothetical protein
LTTAELDDWQLRFPAYRLPSDLRQFLMRANGVQLWADLDTQESYLGILPLAEWTDAARASIAYVFDEPPKATLVMSFARDTSGYAVLDTEGERYLWCDLIGRPELIGDSIVDLLEYWWTHCQLDPRKVVPTT